MRINDLGNTATDFASDDYIAIDGTTNGSRKIKNDSLLMVTAQNALAVNLAPEFDSTRTASNPYKTGEVVARKGMLYEFLVDHYGAWNSAKVRQFETSKQIKSIEKNTIFWKDEKSSLVSGTLYNLSVGIGNVVDLSGYSSSGWSKKIVCAKGDMFKVKGYSGSTPRLYGFVDENNLLVEVANNSYSQADYLLVIAPTNGTFIYQSIDGPSRGLMSVISTNSIMYDITNANTNISDLAEHIGDKNTSYESERKNLKRTIVDLSVGIGNVVDLNGYSTADWYGIVIPCKKFDSFKIKGQGSSGKPRLWGFVDSSNVLISVADPGAIAENDYLILIAPEEGNFVYNTNHVPYREVLKQVDQTDKNNLIENRIENLEEVKLSEIEIEKELVDVSSELANFTFSESANNPIMSQVYSYFDSLVTNYPDFVTKQDAAVLLDLQYPAYASGYNTYMYKFSNENSYVGNGSGGVCEKKKILIFGGVHGTEIAAPANLAIFAKRLCVDCVNDVNLFKLISAFDIYFIPCVNGYGLINHTYTNGNAVNINRNYPTTGWVPNGTGNTWSGSYAGSEFETQLIMGIVNLIKPDVAIDHHNYDVLAQQYYSTSANAKMRNVVYQLLTDCSFVFKKGYPSYFGSDYSLLKDSTGAMPKNVSSASTDMGRFPVWIWENGVNVGGTVEISDNINYLNGEVALNVRGRWGAEVFSIGEFTIRAHISRYAQFALHQ